MLVSRRGEWLLLEIQKECRVEDILAELLLECEYKSSRKDGMLKSKDILWLRVFEDKEIDFIPQEGNLTIVYEDDLLLVVNKPPHMLVHPDSKDGLHTLANYVAYYYQMNGIQTTVRPLHRLDMDTTGLVIFSKCPKLQPYFDKLLQRKEISRYYKAIVNGYYALNQRFSVEAPIGKDRHVNGKRRVSETGKWAKTNVRCLSSSRSKNVSLVECELESGRTHQIRVHLSHHKHPIVGDSLYNSVPSEIRMALHAYKLKITSLLYPMEFEIEIPMARDLAKFMKQNNLR